ncbi:MDR/zinc-dependent alcohol dehydrogenase-like family protein [Flindersiella endophytica]
MRALTVASGQGQASPDLSEISAPGPSDRDLLVSAVALGVCGTDRSVIGHGVRRPPAGRDWMVVGHEGLGRVLAAPSGSGFQAGDLVVGIVRRPDPRPCTLCASGQLDLCLYTDYDESGIVGRDGYAAERYLLEPEYAIPVSASLGLAGVLVEPASIVAKAWERIDALAPLPGKGRRALVLGAGPIGLLAALLGVQREYDVHVVDQVTSGPKPSLVRALGATYHSDLADLSRFTGGFDAVVECSGALVAEAIQHTGRSGTACLVSSAHGGADKTLNVGDLSRAMVGGNRAFAGIVSSNRRHFEAGQAALQSADRSWLESLMTPVVSLTDYRSAFEAGPEAVKAVIRFED